MRKKTFNWTAVVCGIALLVTLSLIALLALRAPRGEEWVSDPSVERPWGRGEWEKLMKSSARSYMTGSMSHLNTLRFLTPVITTESITVTYSPSRVLEANMIANNVRKLALGETGKTGAGSVTLQYLSAAFPDQVNKSVNGRYATGDFYTPDGKLASEKETRGISGRSSFSRYNSHRGSKVELFFKLKGLGYGDMLSVKAFDRASKVRLGEGSSSSFSSRPNFSSYSVDVKLATWRSAPLDIVLDVAHGPAQTKEMLPIINREANFSGVRCRLLAIVPGRRESFGWSQGSEHKVRIRLNQKEKEGAIFLFGVSPYNLSKRLKAELLDSEGKDIGSTSSNGSPIFVASTTQSLDKVASIRVLYNDKMTRFVFPVAAIPCVPPENDKIDNLFNARIPYLEVRSEGDIREFLQNSLWLRHPTSFNASALPVAPFPRAYLNTTPREVMEDLMESRPDKIVRVDMASGTFSIEPPLSFSARCREAWNHFAARLGLGGRSRPAPPPVRRSAPPSPSTSSP